MKEEKLLYQIRALEKLVCREFICNDKIGNICLPTPTQMQIIEYMLEHARETIYQKDLEKFLNLSRATVSGVLQTMEKNHFIERIMDINDSRIKRVIMNESAKRIFFAQKQKADEIEKLMTKDISQKELLEFIHIIEKMQSNLKLVTKKEGKEYVKTN